MAARSALPARSSLAIPVALLAAAALCACDAGALVSYRGSSFYVDPAVAADGDGSAGHPWKSLQNVLDTLVETTAYESYPYYESKGMVVVHKGAPVKPGDTIVLADGDYGPLIIHEMRNLREIAIRAADGAHPRFSGIHVRSSARWRLSGLTVDGPTYESPNSSRTMLFIESHDWRGKAGDIVVEDCAFTSGRGLDPRAMSAQQWNDLAWTGIGADGDRLTIRNNELTTVNFGITVSGNGCLVAGNVIDGFCGDALRGLGDDLVFEYNTVENCYVVNDNHCDGFQSWADFETGDPPERVTLRGNRIFQWTGERPALSEYLQGIGLYDGPYVEWRIENNLVVTDMYHGISVYGGIGCEIVNNTVADEEAGNATAPWIMVTDHKDGTPSSLCVVRNNIAPSVSAGTGTVIDHNYEARTDEYASLFVSPTDRDFRLLPGTALVDSGYYALAPAWDIDRVLRPRGSGYDLGAFER